MIRLRARFARPGAGLLPALLAALFLIGCGERARELPPGFDSGGSVRSYAVDLDGAVAGVIHERRGLSAAGAPRMDTRVEMMLPGSGRLLREERLQFADTPPYPLLRRTRFTRTPAGIEHHETDTFDSDGPLLADLDSTPALAGAAKGSRLEQQGLFAAANGSRMLTAWRVRQQDDAGTFAEGERADGASVALWLDPDGTPERYRIGRSFELRRVAQAPELPASGGTLLLLPVGRSLGDHHRIDAMQVHVEGPAAELFRPGPGLEVRSTASGVALNSRRLAAGTADAEHLALIEDIMAEVRSRIRYHAGAAPPSLDALLADGRGDCYEFAALFDAMASAAGFDSRVVTGLAWAGDEQQGFAPHAWNELRLGDGWVSVDPTWNRIGADAARLRFPEDPALQLDLQLALTRSTLTIASALP